MELLQIREKEIFETLRKLKGIDFVVIGGYAVNAYTLPRFSVDCDLVVLSHADLKRIEKLLLKSGYSRGNSVRKDMPYHGSFIRFEKEIKENFCVSVDVLVKEVLDRQTGAVFSADWVFGNSMVQLLRGKTIAENMSVRIIAVDALFIMKLISCRSTDIRDLFMLMTYIKDKIWIKEEVSSRFDLDNRILKFKKTILSKQFRDGLQGVFGFINPDVFEKHKNLVLDFED